jgi:hypothetical protein
MTAEFSGPDVRCIVSGRGGGTYHHILTQKRFPQFKYEDWNKLPLSNELHVEIHKLGLLKMSQKYPQIRAWTIKHGWSFCPVLLNWSNDKKKG